MFGKRSIPQLVVRAHDPRRWRVVSGALAVVWLATVVAAWGLGARYAAPRMDDLGSRVGRLETELERTARDLAASQEKLTVVERAEQVSRTANESLQDTLREREEEIAALRADLAFYQRLVGGRAPRVGLQAHEFALRPIGDSGGFAFRLTLTQNLKKAATNEGAVELAVEGVRDKRLQTLTWAELVQDAAAAPLRFAFKYFQRLEGNLMLPEGFTPNRVRIVVQSKAGDRAEQSFAWDEALASGENDDVWQ